MDELLIEVKVLDSGHGYVLVVIGQVDGKRTKLREHYDTEAAVKTRLGTIWDFWAAQVDAE